jgi:hypothetical protein
MTPDVGAFVSTGGAVIIGLGLLAVLFLLFCVLPAQDLAAVEDQKRWAELEDIDWIEPWPFEQGTSWRS